VTTEQLLDDIVRREGGYVEDPADRGGATKFGITADTLGAWRKLLRSATRAEVKALEESEARAIYTARYIAPFAEVLDDELRALLVDIGVNSGPATAVRFLQTALGVMADGVIGKGTRAALAAHPNVRVVYVAVWRARLRLYCDLALKAPEVVAFVKDNPTSKLKFLNGWLARHAEFVS
jgi:lysozyme family protein